MTTWRRNVMMMMMMPFFFPLFSNDVLRYGRRSSLFYSHTDQKERVLLRLFCEPPSAMMQKARVHADVHAGRRDRVQRIPARSVLHARYRSQVRRRRRPFYCLLLPPPFCEVFDRSFVETDARACSFFRPFLIESQRR